MSDAAGRPVRTRWTTGRVEAFSDGVFAIAITLLVLEIRISPADLHDLRHALLHLWPAYLAYVTSFLTIGGLWMAHHSLFVRLRFVDPVLLRLNLLLLMVTAFLPFPTAVLAEALPATNDDERTAVALYGLTALAIELLLQACNRYAASRPELVAGGPAQEPAPAASAGRGRRSTLAAGLYVAAIVVGIAAFPKVAAVAYLAVALRGVLVIGGEGHVALRPLRRRRNA